MALASASGAAAVTFEVTGRGLPVHPVRPDFIGLALEYRSVPSYTGPASGPVNPLLVQLVRNLDPAGRPLLRIGGQSGDRTWWPVRGIKRPLGITYDLTPGWMASARALAQALDARLILGVGLEADVPTIDQVEARELRSRIGRRYLDAIELGNEPELYRVVPWYRIIHGKPVPWYDAAGAPAYARGPGWSAGAFLSDWGRTRRVLAGLPLAGPSTGNLTWLADFTHAFLAPRSQLRTLTWHAYGLDNCVRTPASPQYPSVPHLLSTTAATGWSAGIGPYVGLAHRDGAAFVLDETGSISCNGHPGVSNTFASALWVVSMLFTAASDGVDAVELHTYPGLPNDLFDFARTSAGVWRAAVRPLYYGALLFAQAAPAGSRPLRVRSPAPGQVRAWAVRAPDGSLHVVLLNGAVRRSAHVVIAAAGTAANGSLTRLRAASAYATGAVTLGGQSFGSATSSGRLAAPIQIRATAHDGRFAVTLPGASAALLSVPAR